ncbi:MAG TPA: tetratricopeptide repeat protein [Rhodopila sp.]|nr:tetratricopeptide repeat protein [Rhodopila sp.]
MLSRPPPSLQDGLNRQRNGDLAAAESIYRAILRDTPDDRMAQTLLGLVLCATDRYDTGIETLRAASPNHAFACYSLGQALASRSRLEEATQAFRQSIALQPDVPTAHIALGETLAASNDQAGAATAIRRALELDPANPDAHLACGKLLHRLGRTQQAVPHLRTATDLAPARTEPWAALGCAHLALNQTDEAAAATAQAITLDPASPIAHRQMGDIRQRQRDPASAETCYRRAIALAPAQPESHCHLSNALHSLGRFEEAAAAAATAIALRPDYADAHTNHGNAMLALLRYDAAETDYRTAARLQPNSPAVHSNLGTVLTAQRKLDEALKAQRHALAIDPSFIDARYNHGITLLLAGHLEPGWRHYETRWQLPWNKPRAFPKPQWTGQPLQGRTILLHAEQGLGDTLQMARYIPLVAATGARVHLEVHPPLLRLLRTLPGIDQAIPLGAPLPPFDLHCPLFSLPLAFNTTLETIPAAPYLPAHPTWPVPDAVAASRHKLRAHTGLRVGLVWQGASGIGAHVNRERSLSPHHFARLAAVPGVALFSLQKDQDAAAARQAASLGITDLMGGVADFADTAALVADLDLVISVDTSTAHLAAAMGKPVWLLSRFSGCWRWLTDRNDSPWYPTLRLYRQDASRDWAEVLVRLTRDLAHAATTRQPAPGPVAA